MLHVARQRSVDRSQRTTIDEFHRVIPNADVLRNPSLPVVSGTAVAAEK